MKRLALVALLSSLIACDKAEPSTGDPLTRGEIAVSLLDSLFNHGDVTAIDQYIGATYTQHNPLVPDGPDALRGLIESLAGNPDASFMPYRVIEDGDLVAVHAHYEFAPDSPGFAVVDLFRFEGDKIVEHWDVLQEVVTETASGNSMFDGGGNPAASVSAADLERNKATAVRLFEELFNQKNIAVVDELITEEYIQHNPIAPNGREALKELATSLFETLPEFHLSIKRVRAQGDLVVLHSHSTIAESDRGNEYTGGAVMDILRFDENGIIVEHWDVLQDVPPESANGHTMFDGGGGL